MCLYECVCLCTLVCTNVFVCVSVCLYACVCICTYVSKYVCACVCVCVVCPSNKISEKKKILCNTASLLYFWRISGQGLVKIRQKNTVTDASTLLVRLAVELPSGQAYNARCLQCGRNCQTPGEGQRYYGEGEDVWGRMTCVSYLSY